MITDTHSRPAPAPLPYSSQAGRGEIPAAPPADPASHLPDDPAAPLMLEDEATFWIVTGLLAAFILVMLLVSLTGGL